MTTHEKRYYGTPVSLLDRVLLVLLGKEMWAKHVLLDNMIVASGDIHDDDFPEIIHFEYEIRTVKGCTTEYYWKWTHTCNGVLEHFSGNTKEVLAYLDEHVPKG